MRPLPLEKFLPDLFLYECEEMYIALLKSEFNLPAGTHAHSGFEFVIPLNDMPFMIIDSKEFYGLRNHIIPINPNQQHGSYKDMFNVRFLDMLIDDNFINEVAKNIFGTGIETIVFRNGNYHLGEKLQSAIENFVDEARGTVHGKELMMHTLSNHIAVLIIREISNNTPCYENVPIDTDAYKIKEVITYMHKNYRSVCSLKELSKIAGISSYHLIRIFKNSTGMTPHEYLLDIRLREAKELLKEKKKAIIDICFECGFNNVSHFNRLFKKRLGTTPSLYRGSLRD